jgi:hypothetical protein
MTTSHVTAFRYAVLTRADNDSVRDAYLRWLEDGHLAEVVEAGALSGEILRHDDPLLVESVYWFASREAFADYERDHAPRLRAEGRERFPSGLAFTRSTATRTLRHEARGR